MTKKILSLLACSVMALAMPLGALADKTYYGPGHDSYRNRHSTSYHQQEQRLRNLRDFDQIEVNGSIEVIYTQGSGYNVDVKPLRDMKGHIQVRTQGHKLILSQKSNGSAKRVKVYISAPSLKTIAVNGASKFKASQVSSTKLHMRANGASHIDIGQVNCRSLKIEAEGASKVSLSANCNETLKVSNNGSSKTNIDAHARIIKIDNSGASKLDARVDCDRIDVQCSGAGTVNLKGYANQSRLQRSGSGVIRTHGLHRN